VKTYGTLGKILLSNFNLGGRKFVHISKLMIAYVEYIPYGYHL